MNTKKGRKIKIADTTLRDGAQTIGVHFTVESKLQIASQLAKLGVDVIEIGCPVGSPQELEVAKKAAEQLKNEKLSLAAFARAKERDIDAAWEGVGRHPKPLLALLTSVSDIHLEKKFNSGRKEMLEKFSEMIRYGKKVGFKDILVYLEDGTRTDYPYIKELVSAFVQAGAKTVSIPDTVGFVNSPEKYGEIFSSLIRDLDLKNITLSAHTHNDKGLAVANALAALRGGAGQIECTVNGLGERAGNASLGAVLLNLYSQDAGKWSSVDYGVKTGVNLKEYAATARMVGELGGLGVAGNEPVVGSSVYTTAAGIHQDGILKDRATYFCFDPTIFGVDSSEKLITFNMQSGLKGIIKVLKDMGIECERKTAEKIYEQVILLAQQKTPSPEDIRVIALDIMEESDAIIDLKICKATTGIVPCSAEVVLERVADKSTLRGIGYGDGPFSAFMDITCDLLGLQAKIKDYHDIVVGEGRQAQMQCFVACEIEGKVYRGRGVSTDIVTAGCRAFMKCVNSYFREQDAEK